MQADTIVRRHSSLRIASLRLSWSVPNREIGYRDDPARQKKDLWGYVQEDSGAEAFLLALTHDSPTWKSGHEAFFITAPDTLQNRDTKELYEMFYAQVPIKDGKNLDGKKGFFDCSKAERLLGWKHTKSPTT